MKVMYNYETFLAFIWPPDAKSFFSVKNTGYESNWHFSSPDLLVSSRNGNTMKPMTSVLVLNIFWHFFVTYCFSSWSWKLWIGIWEFESSRGLNLSKLPFEDLFYFKCQDCSTNIPRWFMILNNRAHAPEFSFRKKNVVWNCILWAVFNSQAPDLPCTAVWYVFRL